VYYLERQQDGSRVEGEVSIPILQGPDGETLHLTCARPQLGMSLFVGYRSMLGGLSHWRGRVTSRVTMIVSETPTHVVFDTQSGSRYVWRFEAIKPAGIETSRLH
jgi:hypothetical protein